jgi:hypothetical protein
MKFYFYKFLNNITFSHTSQARENGRYYYFSRYKLWVILKKNFTDEDPLKKGWQFLSGNLIVFSLSNETVSKYVVTLNFWEVYDFFCLIILLLRSKLTSHQRNFYKFRNSRRISSQMIGNFKTIFEDFPGDIFKQFWKDRFYSWFPRTYKKFRYRRQIFFVGPTLP